MTVNRLTVAAPADYHVHFRDGALRQLVAPSVRDGGVRLALAMPNLVPPVTTTEMALAYRERLLSDCPELKLVMTLFLSPELTVDEVRKAHKAGIRGVKSYPRGVTTNSGTGVESYDVYYEVFGEMENLDMVLNLHGEVPSSPAEVREFRTLGFRPHADLPSRRTLACSMQRKSSFRISIRCIDGFPN